MPGKRLSMRKIREVLRLRFEAGLSGRQIAHSCGMGRTTVREYLDRAQSAGLSWPLPEGMNEGALEALLYPAAPLDGAARPLPDWQQVHKELKGRGVTLRILWEEHKAAHPEGLQYSRFCDLYRAWKGRLPVWMRQEHKAGEKLFVDYAGMTMPVRDPKTGAVRQAQVFVAAMGASYYTYAEATWTQALPDFIASHARAFAFFGGVSELLVPDNLRSAVSRACRYEPDANPTYTRLAEHYGTAILPARPLKPKDKSRVESSVNGVEQRILAKLRHQTFLSLEELNRAIRELLEEYNDRPFQRLEGSRRSVFEKIEKPALKPLPRLPFEYEEWERRRVNLDYHVRPQADGHNYSVPFRLVGESVDVRLTAGTVECFHKGERVASHVRSHQKNGHTTLPGHMPEQHREHAKWTPERIIHWVGKAGPFAAQVARRIIASRPHPQQGFQACRGLVRLGEAYGSERLDAACERALAINSASYKSVSEILKQGLDRRPLPKPGTSPPAITHDNVRGAQYYQPQTPAGDPPAGPTEKEPSSC
jgi:transposase